MAPRKGVFLKRMAKINLQINLRRQESNTEWRISVYFLPGKVERLLNPMDHIRLWWIINKRTGEEKSDFQSIWKVINDVSVSFWQSAYGGIRISSFKIFKSSRESYEIMEHRNICQNLLCFPSRTQEKQKESNLELELT